MIDLRPDHLDTVQRILAEHVPECEVRAFGSRAAWTAKDYSDLDLAVVGAGPLDWRTLGQLKEAFEESSLPMRVDVLDWHAISESFRKVIEQDYAVLQNGTSSDGAGLPGEWRRCTLGELTDNFDAIRIPVKQRDRRPGPYPYYGASGVVDHVDGFLFDGEYLLIAEDGENLRTRTTPIAFLANGKFWVNNHAHIVRGNSNANTRFLKYALSGLDISGYLTGSTMPKLTQGNVNRISLLTPPLPTQRAIAHVLGTLDEKIELNRRMNETLEAMARALFKDWFVDFGPVRAKMAGREPYLPPDVWALFPDRLAPSELGDIPAGWTIANIESLCVSVASGGTPARKNSAFWDQGTIPWYKTGEFLDGALIDSNEHITQKALANSSAKLWPKGTILFALYASPTVGRIGLLTRPGTTNQAAAGLIAKPAYGTPFLRRTLIRARSSLQRIAVGAAQQNINQRLLREHRIVAPNAMVADAYSRLMAPGDDRQVAMAEESRTLTALRDALLPSLVSGTVRLG